MSRVRRLIGLFVRDRERLDRWMKLYIHHRNLYAKGQAEFGFVKGLVSLQAIMITWMFLKTTFPFLDNWMFFTFAPILVVLKILLHWVLGYWWEMNNFYDREADWANTRNPVLNGLDRKILKTDE